MTKFEVKKVEAKELTLKEMDTVSGGLSAAALRRITSAAVGLERRKPQRVPRRHGGQTNR